MSPSITKPSKKAMLVVVLLGYLMIVLDLNIINTALPHIKNSMAISAITLSWVQNAYLLCFGGFLLMAARAGDVIGKKRIFQWGVVLFALASLIIGVAPSPFTLIWARACQGLGAAIIAPTVLSLISANFSEGAERTNALAWYSIIAGAGASAGLILGGAITSYLSWRIGFLINVPIGIGLWIAIRHIIDESNNRRLDSFANFDFFGVVLSIIGMCLLIYAIIQVAQTGWHHLQTDAFLIAAIVCLSLFFIYQSKTKHPLLPLRLLRFKDRSAAYLARMLFIGSVLAFFFFTTQFMQEVMGLSAMQAGLGFLPMTLPTFVAALAVPSLNRRLGNSWLLFWSLVLMAAGLLWLGQADQHAIYWRDLALPMVLLGLGNGAGLGPLTIAGMRGVKPRDHGAVAGIINTAHQLGGAIGLSVAVLVYALFSRTDTQPMVQIADGVAATNTLGGIMNILGVLLTALFIIPNTSRRKPSPSAH